MSERFMTLPEIEDAAKHALPPKVWDFGAGGAGGNFRVGRWDLRNQNDLDPRGRDERAVVVRDPALDRGQLVRHVAAAAAG